MNLWTDDNASMMEAFMASADLPPFPWGATAGGGNSSAAAATPPPHESNTTTEAKTRADTDTGTGEEFGLLQVYCISFLGYLIHVTVIFYVRTIRLF